MAFVKVWINSKCLNANIGLIKLANVAQKFKAFDVGEFYQTLLCSNCLLLQRGQDAGDSSGALPQMSLPSQRETVGETRGMERLALSVQRELR